MISDATIVLVLGCHEPHLNKTVKLIDKSVFWPLSQPAGPPSLVGSPHPLRHNNIEIRTGGNSTVASEYSSERTNFLALTLSQK